MRQISVVSENINPDLRRQTWAEGFSFEVMQRMLHSHNKLINLRNLHDMGSLVNDAGENEWCLEHWCQGGIDDVSWSLANHNDAFHEKEIILR